MDDIKAKQQVVEKIKEASKILITVSNDPSVDALSAALGLTLLFEKQEKYATAVFSGETPPAIAFLKPENTFDDTTDSLRDFIIALNKEKADHLRYKVEGDSVKIFITPYKTTIDKSDLEFSQGDYNVELVIALGVDSQDHLDKALDTHGQILHDATVITVTAGDQTSNLGGIDWHDAGASSLSEMVAGLAEALKTDKKKSLVNAQIATALLTGIVAQTDRFSNENTTSKVMTVAAQLMTAGADQQLIATELQAKAEEPQAPEEVVDIDEVADDGSLGNISIHNDAISIDHSDETLTELEERVQAKHEDIEEEVEALVEEEGPEPSNEPEPAAEPAPYIAPEPTPPANFVPQPVEEPTPEPIFEPIATPAPEPTQATEAPVIPTLPPIDASVSNQVSNVYTKEDEVEPTFGGTLNATTEQAEEEARKLALSDQNKTILSHAYLGGEAEQANSPSDSTTAGFPGTPPVAPGSVGVNEVEEGVHSAYAFDDANEQPAVGYGVSGEKVIAPLPANNTPPADLGLPLPPPLPDFSQGGIAPPPPIFTAPAGAGYMPQPVSQGEILGDILAPEAPDPNSAYAFEPIETPIPAPPTTPDTNNPGQFKIPS